MEFPISQFVQFEWHNLVIFFRKECDKIVFVGPRLGGESVQEVQYD